MRAKSISAAVGAAVAVVMAGCTAIGPRAVRSDRVDYNIAGQQTSNEQLLLNLVRLRYRDTPYFLEVASISTSLSLSGSANASAAIPEAQSHSYGLGTGLSYTEQPTITYSPLQGDQFVKQLLSPVDLDTILLLYYSGWSVERIFRVCVQSVNDVKNAPSASGPTPDYVPQYKEFLEVARLLRSLQLNGMLDMGRTESKGQGPSTIEIRIDEQALKSYEAQQLFKLLKLKPEHGYFPLTTEIGTDGEQHISVVLRSLLASMFYASQSVKVPPEDEQRGLVTVSRDVDGQPFDWCNVVGGLIDIHWAKHRPSSAYVTVHYRGTWFYIDDSDLTSKSTFSLLTQLFALKSGQIKSVGPILTLPVSQ